MSSQNAAKVAGSPAPPGTCAPVNARCRPASNAPATTSQQPTTTYQPSSLSFSSSAAFQQVKQTQASLARLSRVHNHQHQSLANHNQHLSQTNQSSQQQQVISSSSSKSESSAPNNNVVGQQTATTSKSTTFIDCLIRRFKDCFSEDFCTVPMFVVGNLSPGSDGTHLILPPCVSLGRQSISRFAGPKNLRLMNSIRESCRSIEELDLGGNKLTDLIEVYKILQCTPNLKFLNLSENDLSRSSPVAMANCPATSLSSALSTPSPGGSLSVQSQQWSVNASSASQRNCLAPINQNCQQNAQIGSRRHSSLCTAPGGAPSTGGGQSTISGQRIRPVVSRVAEARRLAAAAAVAQSKKTSPSVASKLTDPATRAAGRASARGSSAAGCGSHTTTSSGRAVNVSTAGDKLTAAHQRRLTGTASTMHLARSLSSLSSKDVVRATANSSMAAACLTGHHRTSVRANKESCVGAHRAAKSAEDTPTTTKQPATDGSTRDPSSTSPGETQSSSPKLDTSNKLFVEPLIVETEDVDMASGEQTQLSPPPNNCPASTATSSNSSSNRLSGTTSGHQQAKSSSQAVSGGATNIVQLPIRPSNIVFASSTTYSSNHQSPNFRRTFESIKALALNNTGCQWRVVCSILSRMPNLEELHLSLNNYERIDLDPNEFKHCSLKRLYLCNNPKLTNWEELDKLLSAFPSLQALSIADCNISQIPENLDRAREWRKLCGLNINGWPIKEWPVIERLNQLPSLTDLKCRNLEILSTIDEPRQHLIARLPKLKRLNGSEIEEREHAEKIFLRFFMANSHLERPPRFHELVQIHGEVIPVDVDVDLSPPSQANVRVIFLNKSYYRKENEDDIFMSEDFLTKLMDNVDAPQNSNALVQQQQDSMELGTCYAVDSATTTTTKSTSQKQDSKLQSTTGDQGYIRLFKDESQEVVAIDIDLRQSVRKFKSIVANIFDLESQNLILYYIDHEMVGLMGPELIKHNKKKLWNYNVQDGDQFIVEER